MLDITEDEAHVLISSTSKNGSKFTIGYTKDAGYTSDEISEGLRSAKTASGGFAEINWPPGKSPSETSGDAHIIGIVEGYVSHDRGTIYEYRVNFKNSQGWGFVFKDGSGGEYHISTILNGWHYIDYNSSNPTMIGVKQS